MVTLENTAHPLHLWIWYPLRPHEYAKNASWVHRTRVSPERAHIYLALRRLNFMLPGSPSRRRVCGLAKKRNGQSKASIRTKFYSFDKIFPSREIKSAHRRTKISDPFLIGALSRAYLSSPSPSPHNFTPWNTRANWYAAENEGANTLDAGGLNCLKEVDPSLFFYRWPPI